MLEVQIRQKRSNYKTKDMRLIIISSSSSGNGYALDSGKDILLLESGVKFKEVQKAIDFRVDSVVGCLTSHAHGDHAKYAEEFAKHGVKIYCNEDVKSKKDFPYGSYEVVQQGKTRTVGSFRVVPFGLHHDVECYGYLIYHKDCGTILFALDSYKFDFAVSGIDHWLIEANYDDRILRANVEDGKIDRAQANRLMLSHMSLDNTIHYLHECKAEQSKNIILCHLSERNSDPDAFKSKVMGEFGVPTYIASKGKVIELNKDVI